MSEPVGDQASVRMAGAVLEPVLEEEGGRGPRREEGFGSVEGGMSA